MTLKCPRQYERGSNMQKSSYSYKQLLNRGAITVTTMTAIRFWLVNNGGLCHRHTSKAGINCSWWQGQALGVLYQTVVMTTIIHPWMSGATTRQGPNFRLVLFSHNSEHALRLRWGGHPVIRSEESVSFREIKGFQIRKEHGCLSGRGLREMYVNSLQSAAYTPMYHIKAHTHTRTYTHRTTQRHTQRHTHYAAVVRTHNVM